MPRHDQQRDGRKYESHDKRQPRPTHIESDRGLGLEGQYADEVDRPHHAPGDDERRK